MEIKMTKYQKSYQKHREERKRKAREYYHKHREEKIEYSSQYRADNKAKISKSFIKYYEENKEGLLADAKDRYGRLSKENGKKYLEYKSLHPCVICGEENPIVLEFHHKVKRENKKSRISHLIFSRAKWDKILKEIEKCVVLCSNCHLIVHDQMKRCKNKDTQFSLEAYIKAKKEQDIIPTQSLPLSDANITP